MKGSMAGGFILLVSLHLFPLVFGCTEFIIPCQDGAKVVGRTMEFGVEVKYFVETAPAGVEYQARKIPAGESKCAGVPLKTWKSNSAQVYFTPNEGALPKYLWFDGQNSDGLSVGVLYFPGYAEVPKASEIPKEKCGDAISHYDVSKFIQGTYKTVQEVRDAFDNDKFPFVWEELLQVPDGKGGLADYIAPMHWSVIDRTGDGLILEYSKERGRRIYKNNLGIFTNSPHYDWHETNMRNYLNLQAETLPDRDFMTPDGVKMSISVFGEGSGLIGVPGDFTPPSRFVRIGALNLFSNSKATDVKQGVVQAWHLLNSVDITKGVAGEDSTTWSVVKDLRNNVLYFRSYNNLGIRKIDLNKAAQKSNTMYVTLEDDFEKAVEDVTDRMMKQTEENKKKSEL